MGRCMPVWEEEVRSIFLQVSGLGSWVDDMQSFLEMEWLSFFCSFICFKREVEWEWIRGVYRSKKCSPGICFVALKFGTCVNWSCEKPRMEEQNWGPGVMLSCDCEPLSTLSFSLPPSCVVLTKAGWACPHTCSGQECLVVWLHGITDKRWYSGCMHVTLRRVVSQFRSLVTESS